MNRLICSGAGLQEHSAKARPMDTTAKQPLFSLGLIQMGRLGEVAVKVVAANLQAILGIAVDQLDPMDLPQHAFQQQRQQYDAGLILKHLAQMTLPPHPRILALTTADLCVPILTYVFGEAEVGGKVAIVSTYRLRLNADGTTASLDRYYERLAKVALHEVAHTLAVYHCEDPRCLMRFSAKVHHLDELGILFCERCAYMIREKIRHLSSERA